MSSSSESRPLSCLKVSSTLAWAGLLLSSFLILTLLYASDVYGQQGNWLPFSVKWRTQETMELRSFELMQEGIDKGDVTLYCSPRSKLNAETKKEQADFLCSSILTSVPRVQPTSSISRTVCSEETRTKQTESFKRLWKKFRPLQIKGTKYLGCGHLEGLESFLTTLWDPSEQLVTLVNIGANKGYNLVAWLKEWDLSNSKGPREWGSYLRSKYKEQKGGETSGLCGACGDCHSEPSKSTGASKIMESDRGVHIYAMEPSITNFKLLAEMKAWSGYEKMTLLNAAAANESGFVAFPVTTLGFTRAAVGHHRGRNVDVRIFTVDEFMEEHRIDHIHYLMIDTEGHDPLVLFGSERALNANKIELVEFEYHYIGRWAKFRLQDVVEWLDSLGYDCFLMLWQDETTRNAVLCLTGCWDRSYEMRTWSNVACSSRRNAKLTAYFRTACNALN